jgi:hypothetical protein
VTRYSYCYAGVHAAVGKGSSGACFRNQRADTLSCYDAEGWALVQRDYVLGCRIRLAMGIVGNSRRCGPFFCDLVQLKLMAVSGTYWRWELILSTVSGHDRQVSGSMHDWTRVQAPMTARMTVRGRAHMV